MESEVIYMAMGMDVHKNSITACVMNSEKTVLKTFKFENDEKELVKIAVEYKDESVLIESSTSGKYVARFLRDHGIEVHLASSKKLSVISKSHKKTDKNDSIESLQSLWWTVISMNPTCPQRIWMRSGHW